MKITKFNHKLYLTGIGLLILTLGKAEAQPLEYQSETTLKGSSFNAICYNNNLVNKQDAQFKALSKSGVISINSNITSTHPYVNFAPDDHTLNKSAISYLQSVIDSLNDNPEWKVELTAHTDPSGINSYMRTLSKKRVLSVQDYLQEHGIDKERITIGSYNKRKRNAREGNELRNENNRSVKITFLKPKRG
jgi:outer membrane protein OmpA-like peptidoglycan-associated protein